MKRQGDEEQQGEEEMQKKKAPRTKQRTPLQRAQAAIETVLETTLVCPLTEVLPRDEAALVMASAQLRLQARIPALPTSSLCSTILSR